MFTSSHKNEVGQVYQCWHCNTLFERECDDDAELCPNCDDETQED